MKIKKLDNNVSILTFGILSKVYILKLLIFCLLNLLIRIYCKGCFRCRHIHRFDTYDNEFIIFSFLAGRQEEIPLWGHEFK